MSNASHLQGRIANSGSNIYLKQKAAGGMKITFQATPKNIDEKMLYNILRDYRILNCEVLVRDENSEFILACRRMCIDAAQSRSTTLSTSL